ncbi:uncharacterized protein [Aristolochia californica]|uniref:uncharacterized protein n=1 Tax=Aristolochia californica TaxID=171875 RepID=UPI0035D9D44F
MSDNVKGVTFTPEQVFLLSLLSRIHEQFVSNDFGLAILQILKKASAAIHSTSCAPPIDTLAVEVLEYTLIILRDMCAYVRQDDQSRDSLLAVDLLLSSGLLTFLLDLLHRLEPLEIIRRTRPQDLNQGKRSLWAGRKLGNQREVVELKLQGTVDRPEIANLGMHVEVDQSLDEQN